jgi:phosphoglycolate phosphatase-like HAD superfamily hydrolase
MMKKLLYILFFFFAIQPSFAQDDKTGGPGKLREKMVEYIQNKLGLDKAEAERFQPVFYNYIKELRKTNQEYRDDRLLQQQKVAELRLRYRDQFKPIVGEKRSNDVFKYERDFIEKAADVLQDRRQGRGAGRGKNSKLFSN